MPLLKDILKPEEYEHIKKELIFDDIDTIQVKDITVNQLNSMGLLIYKYGDTYERIMCKSFDLVSYTWIIILGRCLNADKAVY